MANFLGLPYPITDSPQGYFRQVSDANTIKSDLLILLLTNFGERPLLPSFGTNLGSLLFEPNNATIEPIATALITNAIKTWEPRVVINSINVSAPTMADTLNQSNNHVLTITVSFSQFNNLTQVDNLVLQLPLGT